MVAAKHPLLPPIAVSYHNDAVVPRLDELKTSNDDFPGYGETGARKPGGGWAFPGAEGSLFWGRRPQPARPRAGFARVAGVDAGVSRRAPRRAGASAVRCGLPGILAPVSIRHVFDRGDAGEILRFGSVTCCRLPLVASGPAWPRAVEYRLTKRSRWCNEPSDEVSSRGPIVRIVNVLRQKHGVKPPREITRSRSRPCDSPAWGSDSGGSW
jgi:hypothetical protein